MKAGKIENMFKVRVRNFLLNNNLGVHTLAKSAKVNHSSIYRWLDGKQSMKLSTLDKIINCMENYKS